MMFIVGPRPGGMKGKNGRMIEKHNFFVISTVQPSLYKSISVPDIRPNRVVRVGRVSASLTRGF